MITIKTEKDKIAFFPNDDYDILLLGQIIAMSKKSDISVTTSKDDDDFKQVNCIRISDKQLIELIFKGF